MKSLLFPFFSSQMCSVCIIYIYALHEQSKGGGDGGGVEQLEEEEAKLAAMNLMSLERNLSLYRERVK